MAERGLASVIIPTYNRAHLIAEALDSVLAQTYRPVEVVVVDDGSTDGTGDVVNRWRAQVGPRFRLEYIRQQNAGVSAARNRGVAAARGAFIQYLDSDDTLADTEKLARQVAVLREPRAIAFGPWFRSPENRQDDGRLAALANDFVRKNIGTQHIATHALLWPRQAVEDIGPWDETLCSGEDVEYLVRAVVTGWTLRYCPGSWVFCRPHEDPRRSLSHSYSEWAIWSRVRMVEKIQAVIERAGRIHDYRDDLIRAYLRFALSGATRHCESALYCLDRADNLMGARGARSIAIRGLVGYNRGLSYLIGPRLTARFLGILRDAAKVVLGRRGTGLP